MTNQTKIEIRHDSTLGCEGTFLRLITAHGHRDITPSGTVEDAEDARFECRMDLVDQGEITDDCEVVDLR